MRTVTVKLPEEVFQKVSRSAARRRVSKSEIIREALSARETPGESLYSRIEDLVFDGAGKVLDRLMSQFHGELIDLERTPAAETTPESASPPPTA